MHEQSVIECANNLLALDLDPTPRYLLLRDVLRKPPDDPDLISTRSRLSNSKWITQLANTQWSDGSWGRLHSADTYAHQVIPTTEFGVERAVSLGLDVDHVILHKAFKYLESVLSGEKTIRDPAERNDRWQFGVELFVASTLAQFQPNASALDEVWSRWYEIACRSVCTGRYSERDELEAHKTIAGISVERSYLRLSNRYALALLGSRANKLEAEVEKAIFEWIWNRASGIGYFGQKVSEPSNMDSATATELWTRSQELLSVFPSWQHASSTIMDWLWSKRTPDGWWDFGKRMSRSVVLPYSNNWRTRGARQTDWTVRFLVLSSRAADARLSMAG